MTDRSAPQILVVDADPSVAQAIASRLRALDFDVPVTADQAVYALQLARDYSPHLILLDAELPEAFNVAKLLRVGLDTPVVFLTTTPELKTPVLTEPFGHLLKPFDDYQLHITIDVALYKHQLQVACRREVEARRAVEARMSALVDSTPDAVLLADANGLIKSFSRGAEAMFGFSLSAVSDRPLDVLVPATERAGFQTRITSFMRGELSQLTLGETRAFYGIRSDGQIFPAEVSLSKFEHNSEHYLSLFIRDVTQRVELERRIQQGQKLEAVGRLASGIAHDFNNILGSIVGNAWFLERRLPDDDPLQEYARGVMEAADSAAALSRRLLLFSRPHNANTEVIHIDEVVLGMSRLLRRLISAGIGLESVYDAGAVYVSIDRAHFEQVVLNLVVNARDAMPNGGTIRIETGRGRISDHPILAPGRYVTLRVIDEGIGLPDDIKGHIFEPFFTTKALGEGTGIGLSTVDEIVRRAGGLVEAQNNDRRGTTFVVWLPVAETTREKWSAAPLSMPLGTESILFVDDDESVRALAVQALRESGYTVTPAPSPAEALLLAESPSRHFDLLVTDVMLPYLSGPALAERLQAEHPDLVVLFITGHTSASLTGQSVLNKPFTPPVLLNAVREALDAQS